MSRIHVAAVSLLLAVAVVLGALAVGRTTGLGTASRNANDAALAAKTQQLNAYAKRLRQALAQNAAVAAPAAQAPPAARIVYHRPPPIVVVRHRHNGDGGHESEGGGGND